MSCTIPACEENSYAVRLYFLYVGKILFELIPVFECDEVFVGVHV